MYRKPGFMCSTAYLHKDTTPHVSSLVTHSRGAVTQTTYNCSNNGHTSASMSVTARTYSMKAGFPCSRVYRAAAPRGVSQALHQTHVKKQEEGGNKSNQLLTRQTRSQASGRKCRETEPSLSAGNTIYSVNVDPQACNSPKRRTCVGGQGTENRTIRIRHSVRSTVVDKHKQQRHASIRKQRHGRQSRKEIRNHVEWKKQQRCRFYHYLCGDPNFFLLFTRCQIHTHQQVRHTPTSSSLTPRARKRITTHLTGRVPLPDVVHWFAWLLQLQVPACEL